MLGSLILYLKDMRIMMFQLSRFYRRVDATGHEPLNPKTQMRPDRTIEALDTNLKVLGLRV